MFAAINSKSVVSSSLDPLDRIAIAYLCLPLVIFLIGWLEVWAAVPLLACVIYALRPLIAALPIGGSRLPITPLQLTVGVLVGCGWTVFGGIGHLFYSNYDWHLRDAVLHDLVTSPWPIGYGLLDGKESLLRAPLAFYLPAALVGKVAGLATAHFALAAWTAVGATLFLLQVLSLTPSRLSIAATVAAVVVLFSGFDVIGNLLNNPRFIALWDSKRHLEWWAGTYQYSSMTTQLFWAPSHALGGWLLIGLLYRDQRGTPLDSMLPIVVVAIALWSPLAAIGVVPFVLWKVLAAMARERSGRLLDPRVWAPALVVGIVVAAYVSLNTEGIHREWEVGRMGKGVADISMDFLRLAQFFLLEAGLIGFAILAIRRSSEVALALVVLVLLPLVNFGPGNDLVMRSSIPSLAVLAIAACLALFRDESTTSAVRKKVLLGCLLAIGAVTPFTEFARAIMLPSWPINLQATLIGAACGKYPEHYVARMGDDPILRLLRQPYRIPLGPQGKQACSNPALFLYWKGIQS
jgi:hypothetical protein